MKKISRLIENYDLFILVLICGTFYNTLYYHPFNIPTNIFLPVSIIWSILFIYKNFINIKTNKYHLLWGCLFLFSYLISTCLNFKNLGLESFINWYIMAVFVLAVYFSSHHSEYILNSIIMLNMFFSLISFATFAFNIYYTDKFRVIGYGGVRLYGIYNNPNTLGIIAGLMFLLSLYFIKQKKNLILHISNCGLMLSVLFLSKCRNAILFLFTAVILYIIYRLFKRITVKERLIIALFIFFAINFLLIFSLFNSDIFKIFSKLSSGRLTIWRDSLAIFLKNPVLGYGVSSLNNQVCDVLKLKDNIICLDFIVGSHNLCVDLLFMGGVLGCATFAVFLNKCFRKLNERFPLELEIVLIYILFISTLDHGIIFSNSLLALVFWIILSMGKEHNQ